MRGGGAEAGGRLAHRNKSHTFVTTPALTRKGTLPGAIPCQGRCDGLAQATPLHPHIYMNLDTYQSRLVAVQLQSSSMRSSYMKGTAIWGGKGECDACAAHTKGNAGSVCGGGGRVRVGEREGGQWGGGDGDGSWSASWLGTPTRKRKCGTFTHTLLHLCSPEQNALKAAR